MGIIFFNDRSGGENKKASQIAERTSICMSPIVTKRLDKNSVLLGFRCDLFMIPFVESAITSLDYGEENNWRAKKLEKNPKSPYQEYVIVLQKEYAGRTDTVLEAIIGRITKEVYLREIHIWGDAIDFKDLAKPLKRQVGDGAMISQKTMRALENAKIDGGWGLMEMSREEICGIPEMTTEEVARLEKSLAARGTFLRTEIPKLA